MIEIHDPCRSHVVDSHCAGVVVHPLAAIHYHIDVVVRPLGDG